MKEYGTDFSRIASTDERKTNCPAAILKDRPSKRLVATELAESVPPVLRRFPPGARPPGGQTELPGVAPDLLLFRAPLVLPPPAPAGGYSAGRAALADKLTAFSARRLNHASSGTMPLPVSSIGEPCHRARRARNAESGKMGIDTTFVEVMGKGGFDLFQSVQQGRPVRGRNAVPEVYHQGQCAGRSRQYLFGEKPSLNVAHQLIRRQHRKRTTSAYPGCQRSVRCGRSARPGRGSPQCEGHAAVAGSGSVRSTFIMDWIRCCAAGSSGLRRPAAAPPGR